MRQYIIKVPESTLFDELSEEVQAAISNAKGQFPSGLLVGSQSVNGYKLKLLMCNLTIIEFDSAIGALGLDWNILTSENETVDQGLIIPFMLDVLTYNEDGEQVGSEPVTDVTNKLQTYSGRNWSY